MSAIAREGLPVLVQTAEMALRQSARQLLRAAGARSYAAHAARAGEEIFVINEAHKGTSSVMEVRNGVPARRHHTNTNVRLKIAHCACFIILLVFPHQC
jgi:hypothetical protein